MTITVNPGLRGAELAQATAEYITEHPEEWNQDIWLSSCGTRGCIAGRAVWITGEYPVEYSIGQAAADLLGLDYYENIELRSLFLGEWDRVRDPDGTYGNLLPLDERLRRMWAKISGLYPEGSITIPEEYR